MLELALERDRAHQLSSRTADSERRRALVPSAWSVSASMPGVEVIARRWMHEGEARCSQSDNTTHENNKAKPSLHLREKVQRAQKRIEKACRPPNILI